MTSSLHHPSITAAEEGTVLPPLAWFGLMTLLTAACLAPAVVNGTPPVFTDTQGYFENMNSFRPSHMRAFGYGAWLRATGGMLSLWLPAFGQALLSAWLVLRFLSLEATRWPPSWRLGLVVAGVLLLLAGPLPWLASWLMPDLFAGLMVLAILILALHWPRLAVWERVVLVLFMGGVGTIHLTYPPILFGLAIATGVLALLSRAVRQAAARLALVCVVAGGLGYGALIAANFITYKAPTISLGSPVFLFARLLEDGDVPAVLAPYCAAGAPWVSCQYLDRLRGIGNDEFLWMEHSPIRQMGWIPGFYPEAASLNPLLLRELWPRWLVGTLWRTLDQLTAFGMGDGFDQEGPRMLARDIAGFGLPWVAPLMTGSRQFDNGLLGYAPVRLADALSAVGLLAVVGFGAWGLWRRRPALWWPAAVFCLLWLGNAAVVALAAPVHERYGTRLVWVAPLLAFSLLMRVRQVASTSVGQVSAGTRPGLPSAPRPAGADAGTGWS